MDEHFLALDFGSEQISAVLTVYDEETHTCRVRYATRRNCPSVNACYILDFDKTVRCLSELLAEMNDYIPFTPTVVVGLRGNFLSFRRTGGFVAVSGKDQIITPHDVRAALDNSIPENLSDTLEVVDLLPQSYTVDGKVGVQNPVGLTGNCLEAETFLSCGLRTHLTNLNRVMAAVGYEEFEAVPTVLALCSSLLKPEEKKASVLLLDIGLQNMSAALYHKGMLEGAWELPFGAEIIIQEVATILQNEPDEARELLKDYKYGDDEVLDDVLDEAANKLLKKTQKELVQSLCYIKYPPHQIVLTGGGADIPLKNAAKNILQAKRVRLASHDDLIADSEDMLAPAYTSALSLTLYSQLHGGHLRSPAREPSAGFFQKLLAKFGLN